MRLRRVRVLVFYVKGGGRVTARGVSVVLSHLNPRGIMKSKVCKYDKTCSFRLRYPGAYVSTTRHDVEGKDSRRCFRRDAGPASQKII